jgi:hypothetical protein
VISAMVAWFFTPPDAPFWMARALALAGTYLWLTLFIVVQVLWATFTRPKKPLD